jgi:hypothetical protein
LEKAMKNRNASQKREKKKKQRKLKPNMKMGKLKMNIPLLLKSKNLRMNKDGNMIPAHQHIPPSENIA